MIHLRSTLIRFAVCLGLVLALYGSAEARGFLPAVNYGTGTNPLSVAVGDFNGDGKPDVAVANFQDNSVSLLLGKGDGTFQPAKALAVGHGPNFIAVGDFNGDGKLDLVTTNETDSTVSVLLNSSTGFMHAATYSSGGLSPESLAAADFDGDGRLDLVVTNLCDVNCLTGGVVVFLKGDGNGTFQVAGTYDAAFPTSVTAGDFNGDGNVDLAVADFGDGVVNVLLGNGDGSFQPAASFDAGHAPRAVAAGDFNLDGMLDLAVSDSLHTVNVLLGKGDGTFSTAVPYAVGNSVGSLAVADFNGNRTLDFALPVSNSRSSKVTLLLGNGDGTFPSGRQFGTGSGSVFAATGDFNHDGAMDVVTANRSSDNISVLMNSGGTFVTATSSQNPAPVGQSVTFTATVAPSLTTPVPTGTVTLADGATILATVPLDPTGQASFTTSSLSLGTHTIRTKYSGDGNFNPNTGKAIMQIIQ